MGSEEQALLAAVLAEPGDDLPRLALADWWEGQDEWEGGDQRERAEFVRVQCALALEKPYTLTFEGTGYNPPVVMTAPRREANRRYVALRRREGELRWSPYLWAPAGPRWHDAPGWGFEWRRGFIRSATCTAAQWLEHGDLLLAFQPVEEVTLTTVPPWGFRLRVAWPRVRKWHLPIEPARTHGAPWQAVPPDSWG